MTGAGRITSWIENNLLGILMAGAAGFTGYVTGMTTTGLRLDALEKHTAEISQDMKELRALTASQNVRLERLDVQAKMEREERMKGDRQ